MTTIRIDGEALVRFVFDYIPSVNEAIDAARTHWRSKNGRNLNAGIFHTKKWRAKGEDLARDFLRAVGKHDRTCLIQRRAFVWVQVYREKEWPTYDVHNVYLKALLDGFTDAGIWPNDDWPNVPDVLFGWQPYGPTEERANTFVVEVHELDAFIINGVAQVLPMGRIGERGE